MELNETPPKKTPTELTWNVIEGPTGRKINSEPLTEDEAQAMVKQLSESGSGPLVIRSNRVVLMG
jgi:hypothetical protein